MSTSRLPIVGIICDYEIIGPHPFHIAGDKYIQAVVNGCKCIPILIPIFIFILPNIKRND